MWLNNTIGNSVMMIKTSKMQYIVLLLIAKTEYLQGKEPLLFELWRFELGGMVRYAENPFKSYT